MSIKSIKGRDALFTEINITPLTDIFLVLLIIMMVVAPTFQSSNKSINVPEINSGVAIEQRNATVSVTKEGQMFLNDKAITPDQLADALVSIRSTLQKKEVVVKADAKVKSSEIMQIMNAAKEAEYTKLTLAGEPLSKKEQNQLQSGAANAAESPVKKSEHKPSDWVE
jgi:biopolymer transport protein ExbD